MVLKYIFVHTETDKNEIMSGVLGRLPRGSMHVFRQLFDHESFTYTYLLGCPQRKQAVLVDPVDTRVDRDLNLIKELDLNLVYAVNTHCHADHLTATGLLKQRTGCRSVISSASGAQADVHVSDGDSVVYGDHTLRVVATPGHTSGCVTFVNEAERFGLTGDTLLIRGCGRTDFQEGDAGMLWDNVWKKIFTLPADYHLYPAHDYNGRTVTTVQEETLHNPRLTKSREDFVELMDKLGLAYPKKIDTAVPYNLRCGLDSEGRPLDRE